MRYTIWYTGIIPGPHSKATELMLHVNGGDEKGEIRFGMIYELRHNSLEVKNSSSKTLYLLTGAAALTHYHFSAH